MTFRWDFKENKYFKCDKLWFLLGKTWSWSLCNFLPVELFIDEQNGPDTILKMVLLKLGSHCSIKRHTKSSKGEKAGQREKDEEGKTNCYKNNESWVGPSPRVEWSTVCVVVTTDW